MGVNMLSRKYGFGGKADDFVLLEYRFLDVDSFQSNFVACGDEDFCTAVSVRNPSPR